ncbi:MAG: DNA helicase PcrA [Anaerostipes sp.]|nr:DNA helicase PcrA [Anaerostipes sp.]
MGIYDTLNEQQQEAVFCTEGPLLLLAGAGSGKTRVLTHRIAYLMDQGVNPYHIMAITFTNKAAKEMRERVDDLVGFGAEHIWVSTFHSTCVRILRRHIDKLGYGNSFTIYDADDQKSLIKQICKQYKIDTKMMPERRIINEISSAKDEFMTPSEYETRHQYDFKKKKIAQIYKEYQKQLKANNALDFDDLIFKTVELFQFHPEVLDYYQERFRYIMVDEYQDTNTIQFQLVSMLARKYQNLCVVGDDDQSIYKFRGANVKNILNFENVFPEAVTIKLEQNYRSTKNILNAANEVIKHNKGRKTKKLWTENEEGDLIEFHQYGTEYEEARKIIHEIEDLSKEGYDYKNMAILYRTNAQSRVFEESFMIKNIPYRIVGGTNFYQRKEVKDILSYLKVVDNGLDDLAVRRIINVPRRGIGAATIEKINVYSVEHNISFLDACFSADSIDTLGNAKKKINGFADLIREFRRKMQEGSLEELFKYITDETGYIANLKAEETEEAEGRIENINELLNKVVTYEQEAEEASLSELLEEIALVADIDNLEDSDNRVVLMTLHSAKGLEFPYVFICGMEDGIFPSYMTVMSEDDDDMEEERRLCYVGITRAKKKLYLSAAKRRMMQGRTQFNKVSRFIDEIPEQLLQLDTGVNFKEKRPDKALFSSNRSNRFRKPYQAKSFTSTKMDTLPYDVGDMVKHIKFGKGKVLEIVSGGRDYEVTVDFEKAGVKKMFASFAKLKKVE